MRTEKVRFFIFRAYDTFNEEAFQDIVNKVIVYSPNEIGFHLKCGITLRERIER